MPVTADPSIRESASVGQPDSLESTLCTQCGLCCTGALHDSAVLDPAEVPAARALGLPVVDGEKPCFSQPCPKLVGGLCVVYESRPSVCRRYKCQLFLDVEAGATGVDDALATVRTAKELLAQADEVMPEGMTYPEARALAKKPVTADMPAGTVDAPLRLRITAASYYLN